VLTESQGNESVELDSLWVFVDELDFYEKFLGSVVLMARNAAKLDWKRYGTVLAINVRRSNPDKTSRFAFV